MFSVTRFTAGAFEVAFRVLTGDNVVVLEFIVPLSGDKNFKVRPKNRILEPLNGSSQNFRREHRSHFFSYPLSHPTPINLTGTNLPKALIRKSFLGQALEWIGRLASP